MRVRDNDLALRASRAVLKLFKEGFTSAVHQCQLQHSGNVLGPSCRALKASVLLARGSRSLAAHIQYVQRRESGPGPSLAPHTA